MAPSFLGGLANPNGKFNRIMTRVFDMLLLNGLFLLTSIPVVTAGASAAALYYAMAKAVYHERGQVCREYFRAWKRELRQGVCLQLIFLLIAALAGFDLYYALGLTGAMRVCYLALGGVVLFLLLPAYLYVYPLLSRVEGTVKEYLVMGMRMAAQHLLPTVLMLLLEIVLLVLTVFVPPLLLFTPGLFNLITCPQLEKLLRRHLDYAQPVQEENQDAWYREEQGAKPQPPEES